MKQKLLVLCGGQSSEHIVSRMSCTSVLNNLDANKYEITLVGIDLDGGWHYLDAKQTDLAKNTWLDNSSMVEDVYGLLKNQDVAFPVLHGMYGEDGTIQGLFELAKLPYVGCRVMGSSAVSYTHLRAHETGRNLVCRLLLEKKKKEQNKKKKRENIRI